MSTEGHSEESFSDEGISAEQAAANRKRKEAKKVKNQKRRSRKKLKKKLKKDKACFCCGRQFCGCAKPQGQCGKNQFSFFQNQCGCQYCNLCFIRNFIGNATKCEHNRWHVNCAGGCGNNYQIPEGIVGWCAGSIGGLAKEVFE